MLGLFHIGIRQNRHFRNRNDKSQSDQIIGSSSLSSYLVHFLIHCSILATDSTSSCPLIVNVYSTRGGISLYLCLSNILPFSSSLNRIDRVLVLKPFKACLNCLCLTGLVVQHKGISISSVPLFVIRLLNFAVSDISNVAS
jgi:hypothetical protein